MRQFKISTSFTRGSLGKAGGGLDRVGISEGKLLHTEKHEAKLLLSLITVLLEMNCSSTLIRNKA